MIVDTHEKYGLVDILEQKVIDKLEKQLADRLEK